MLPPEETSEPLDYEVHEVDPLHVFIDTSEFVKLNFNFGGRLLTAVVDHVDSGRIVLHSTSVTDAEVRSHIASRVEKAVDEHRKFRKKAFALRHLSTDLFGDLDTEALVAVAIGVYERFVQSTSTRVHDVSQVDVSAVFGRYFAGEPPFGDGKKKCEFPDAFALLAVEAWVSERQWDCFVVASDGDMGPFADQSEFLKCVDGVAKVLSQIEEEDESIARLVATLQRESDPVASGVTAAFERIGFILMDQVGDVEGVVVEHVQVKEIAVSRAGGGAAELVLRARIAFTAEVTFEDRESASYDSEDQQLIIHAYVSEQLERAADLAVNMDVSYTDGSTYQITHLAIDEKDVEVYADPDDRW